MEPTTPRKERRKQSFLWAVTFRKPGDLSRDSNALLKSGLTLRESKQIVWLSFALSFGLIFLLGFLLLRFTRIVQSSAGPIPLILVVLVGVSIFHYWLAKFMLLRFQSKKSNHQQPNP